MTLNPKIKSTIESHIGSTITGMQALSGGCISDAYNITMQSGENYFLKLDNHSNTDMFIKEAHGLKELKNSNTVRIPEVILYDNSFILTELIQTGKRSKSFFVEFGAQFARMHKYHNEHFGFYEDNYIGSNPQINQAGKNEKRNWINFYFNKRILFQYKLAEKNGHATGEMKKGIALLEKMIEDILAGSLEEPSLLHGDLWSGNFMVDENGEPCLIDPAVYYGHREADLAMTKLFGGFDSDFYAAYNEEFPLPDGYRYRENIYKLYHLLNHLNLFGGSYYTQSISIINSYTK